MSDTALDMAVWNAAIPLENAQSEDGDKFKALMKRYEREAGNA